MRDMRDLRDLRDMRDMKRMRGMRGMDVLRYKTLLFVILTLIVFSVGFISALKLLNWSTMEDQKIARGKLIKITAELKPKMDKAEVYQVLDNHKWTAFSEQDNVIRLRTNPQPLPTDWKVRLFFIDNKLAAIKYGTADSILKSPKDAPPDRTFE